MVFNKVNRCTKAKQLYKPYKHFLMSHHRKCLYELDFEIQTT